MYKGYEFNSDILKCPETTGMLKKNRILFLKNHTSFQNWKLENDDEQLQMNFENWMKCNLKPTIDCTKFTTIKIVKQNFLNYMKINQKQIKLKFIPASLIEMWLKRNSMNVQCYFHYKILNVRKTKRNVIIGYKCCSNGNRH